MSEVQTVPVADLEEALARSIPCDGITNKNCARPSCDREATLRWTNPPGACGCLPGHPRQHKCTECWMVLYQTLADHLAQYGYIRCALCHRKYSHVLSFTDYRPF